VAIHECARNFISSTVPLDGIGVEFDDGWLLKDIKRTVHELVALPTWIPEHFSHVKLLRVNVAFLLDLTVQFNIFV
jgi:hypothetical protein